jgi:ubiquinol-cytochrome c reductase cytochrome c1 subunit
MSKRLFASLFAMSLSVLLAMLLPLSFLLLYTSKAYSEETPTIQMKSAEVDITDLPSLQRGFRLFMDHCSGCHGLKMVRYEGVAKDIGIVDQEGKVLGQVVKRDLMFTGDKITDNILTAMRKEEGVTWFGIAPPDLSLEIRARGADWVYNYLLSFYPDDKKTWGVNNKVYPDVAMPNVLANMQARMTPAEFEAAVHDIVNFLSYVAEPMQVKRKLLGIWVLVFLGIFTIFAALLKREYWKDVK